MHHAVDLYIPLDFIFCILCNFSCSTDFFQNELFEKILSGTLSNSLDPDHGRHSVGPDLGTNCLQKSPLARKKAFEEIIEI